METNHAKTPLRAIIEQVSHNSTSWIGNKTGESKSKITGQTFYCPSEGVLDTIKIYPNHVTDNGPLEMTIHSFDPANKTWSPVLGTAIVEINCNDTGKWISFPLSGLQLQKGMNYGFRLHRNKGLIGLGEAAGSHNEQQIKGGQEWIATSDDQNGKYFSYMSLAFKVELRA